VEATSRLLRVFVAALGVCAAALLVGMIVWMLLPIIATVVVLATTGLLALRA
jgi:hypothetical protein